MIIAVAAPDSSRTSSLAALGLAEAWRGRDRDVQLVAPEPPTRSPSGVVCASISTDGVTTLQLGDDLRGSAASHDVTVVETPRDRSRFLRATLSVADVALLVCAPGGDGLWPSGRTVQMARKAAEIRSQLHVGFVVTESALREAPAEDAEPDRADVPLFETILDLSAASADSTATPNRIRRRPFAPDEAGLEMLMDEIEETVVRPKPNTERETRYGRLHSAT